MGLFGKKKPDSFLGVDIGASSVKVVEFVNKKGRATLLTYGYGELPTAEAGDTLFDNPKAAGELLACVCKESGCTSTAVMAALPTSNVFSTILSIPEVKDMRQRQSVVNTEVAKLSPLPLSEMILQTTFLDDVAKPDKKAEKKIGAIPEAPKEKAKDFRVLVTGAAKTFIQKYIETFKAAKLNLQAIDTEALALVRSLVGKDKGAILMLDIGSKRTNIIIVEKGIPFVSRSITIGGNTVTSQLMRTMGLSEMDADRVKRDLGIAPRQDTGLAGGLPKLLEPIMQPLLNEIRYAFQLYANMELAQIKKVEKIIVTGGSAHLPRIPDYLAQMLNMNVYRGDPWARVVYPADLASVLEEIGPRMSVAVGLAMREMD
ncbi:type IV pilus assembly protein PilM [Candidatus Uhrbacteria bacterium]|nr:type IV pilus assembly protein PilM [Candidatus Uhrbacteria bacterium]